MPDEADDWESSLQEIRRAQQEAERMRDQLQAEFNRVEEEFGGIEDKQREKGKESLRKAVLATKAL